MHGVKDKKAPVSLAHETYKNLDAQKVPATLLILSGIAHDIDPQELEIAGIFLKDCFSGKITDRLKY